MAKIVVVEGADKGRVFPLDGDLVTMGRGTECDVVLTDQAVSRRHCQISREDDRWYVIDLESSNRTFLNNDPVEKSELAPDDLVGIGDSELRFELAEDELVEEELNTTIVKEFRVGAGSAFEDHDRTEILTGKFSFLADFGATLDEAEDSRELLTRTLKSLLAVLHGHWAVALVREGGRWKSKVRVGRRVKQAFSRTLLDQLLERGTSILYADVASDAPLSDTESMVASGVQSVVAAPLQSRGRLFGALYFARGQGSFQHEDSFFVSIVCNQIAVLLRNMLKNESLERERGNLLAQIQENHRIVGASGEIQEVLGFIGRAAPAEATVLIRGETGTGKGLVASAIHYASPRAGKPFVEINCAAIPEQLLESELFGHEKGAFTGALSQKKGRFEAADGGTVFLDEIGELSAGCQAKVLRLIEERKFERVGGTRSFEVDVRILAATNRDLAKAVSDGAFREDLYWRLDVLHIELPTLRDRPEDVALLADYFLRQLISTRNIQMDLSPEACEALQQHTWPGNVRQLRNVIENAVIMARGPVIMPEDLRLVDLGGRSTPAAEKRWEPQSLESLEKEHILRVMQWAKGNKSKAAEVLGIERCTLYSRLKNYGWRDSARWGKKRK